MTHAYNQLYLAKSSQAVGNMLHDAVYEFHIGGSDFLSRFIQSDVTEQFENGNPKNIAGKSGLELFIEVIEKTTGEKLNVELSMTYSKPLSFIFILPIFIHILTATEEWHGFCIYGF